MRPTEALTALWHGAALPADALSMIHLSGSEPVLPSSFAIGTAAQVSIAAAALAAAELWRVRSGQRQRVSVEMRHAAVEFRSERYMGLEDGPAPGYMDKIAGVYPCGDGRWVRLHTNFSHHRNGVLALLQCDYDRAAVQRALEAWTADGFDAAATERGLVVAAMRSFLEWDNHLHGKAVAELPVLSIEKLGDAPPEMPAPADRPLGGVRVLDLTRIIAGPVCGRALAVHGADVLLITAPHLPAIERLVIDTGRGKLSAHVDLRGPAGRDALEGLVRGADIFVQSYRPGSLERLGFGPEAVARIRPGIVYVSLSAYGHEGPWANRRGYDSLVQTASGFNVAEADAARADAPTPLPAQALDHASGYLMVLGALAALRRRAIEGGSWHVRVSLVGTGRWLRSLGRVTDGFACTDPGWDDVRDLLEDVPSGFGRFTPVRHSAWLSETPPHWARPSVPLGTHRARLSALSPHSIEVCPPPCGRSR